MDWMTGIQQTIDFIEDNIGAELDINMLAERMFTSQFYFQKVFTILCDCTVVNTYEIDE
jgi:AraC family transcriptional regulator